MVKSGSICLGAPATSTTHRSVAFGLPEMSVNLRFQLRTLQSEFLAEDGTYKDEKDIPGFALTDIAPELFE